MDLAVAAIGTDWFEPVGALATGLAGRIGGASLVLLGAALALHVGKLVARGRAWHNIVGAAYPGEGLRYRHSLGAYLSCVGVNAAVPARPGELLRLVLIRRKAPGTRYQGLASTLVTEAAFDTVTGAAALTAGVMLGWTSFGGSLIPLGSHPWWVVAVAILATVGTYVAWRRLGSKARAAATEAARGFSVFGRPRLYVRAVLSWQVAALVLRLGSIALFLSAFHLPATIQTTLVVLAVQCAANVVPLTPNGAGTQQALLVAALPAGLGAASIVGFGVGSQLVTAAADVGLALGALALMTGSLRWRCLLATEEEAPAGATAI